MLIPSWNLGCRRLRERGLTRHPGRLARQAEPRRKELLPLVIERLADRSARVRRRVAYVLGRDAAEDVPWQVAAEAATRERDTKAQNAIRGLLRAVLRAGKNKEP